MKIAFRPTAEHVTTLTPELRRKREEETAHGLASDDRCAMRLPL